MYYNIEYLYVIQNLVKGPFFHKENESNCRKKYLTLEQTYLVMKESCLNWIFTQWPSF